MQDSNNWSVVPPGAEAENQRKEIQLSEVREVMYTGDGKAVIRENIRKITVENMERERTVDVSDSNLGYIRDAAAELGELLDRGREEREQLERGRAEREQLERGIAERELRDFAGKAQAHNPCVICGTPTQSGCSICYTDYCSSRCQNEDWPEHRHKCPQIARDRYLNSLKQEPVEPMDCYYESEPEPERSIYDVDPTIQYNPRPINTSHLDHRRIIEDHMQNYVPRNGEMNHFHLDPRLNRNRVENTQNNSNTTQQVNADSRDPRLRLTKYSDKNDKHEKEIDKEKVDGTEKRPQIRVRIFMNTEPVPPEPSREIAEPEIHAEKRPPFREDYEVPPTPPPPSISNRERERHAPLGPGSPPRESLRLSPPRQSRRQSPPRDYRRASSPRDRRLSPPRDYRRVSPPRDYRRVSPPRESRRASPPRGSRRVSPPSVSRRPSPPRESRSRHRDSEPSGSRRERLVFKPPIRRSDPPPRPPFGPTDDFISIRSDDVDMQSEGESDFRSYRGRNHFRGKRPLMRSPNDGRPDKENRKSSRRIDLSDIVYDNSEKIYPPIKLKVVGLVKDTDEKYWVVEQSKYDFWKEIQQELIYCHNNPILTPELNLVAACFYEHSWYRAKVVAVRPKVKVQFIDFGDITEYTGKIRDIRPELKRTKPLAFKIQFSDEVPKYKISRDFSGKCFDIEITERTSDKVSICRLGPGPVTVVDTTMDFEDGMRSIKSEPSEVDMEVDGFSDADAMFEPLNLKNNSLVVMTEVYTMNELYVRPADEKFLQKYEDLKLDVNAHAQIEPSYTSPPKMKELCCARLDDEHWHRAIVQSVNEDVSSVLFVDIGTELEVQLRDIKPLPDELKRIPYFAIKVPLEGVSADVRPAEVLTYFNKLISKNTKLVLSYRLDAQSGVLLTENGTGIVVNDYVNRLIVAEIQKTELFFEKDLDYLILERGEVKDLMVTYIEKNEYDKSGVFYMTDPKSPDYKKVNKKFVPEIRDYVMLNKEEYAPQEGELILAYFQGDWYRALAVERLSDELFRVYFVDYGNESVCKTRCIRKIRKDFADAACLAIKCCVTGNEKIQNNSELHRDIFDYIDSNVNNVLLSAKVSKVTPGSMRTMVTYISLPEIEKVMPKAKR